MPLFNLPDWKGALQESFKDYVKTPLETKANELNSKLEQKADQFEVKVAQITQEFKVHNNSFQHAIIAILFASFCVGVIALNWKDNAHD